jgi:phosphatidylglycerol:prolipoprotein diacylglycerol transferase
MHVYTNLLGIHLPSYGLMITTGVVLANLLAILLAKRLKADYNDLLILEGYAILGGLAGAKLLYILVSFRSIDWSGVNNLKAIEMLMESGFVFYGGLIGGLLAFMLGSRIHKINAYEYMSKFIFLIPFIHGFGRIGCFMAGCCYGVPYHGFGAVIFPENSFALPGVELFPVQMAESILLFLIAGIMLVLQLTSTFDFQVEFYFLSYGICRFVLEFFRYDAARGSLGPLSTSQWISCLLVIAGLVSIIVRSSRGRKNATA